MSANIQTALTALKMITIGLIIVPGMMALGNGKTRKAGGELVWLIWVRP